MKRTEIEQLLPAVFQRAVQERTLLAALLEVMEALHAPSETVLSGVDAYFNPHRAPDQFVPFLAGWVDLDRLLPRADAERFPSGLGRLRELVAAAAYLSKWRGTARGLIRFLETATGIAGFSVDEDVPASDGRPQPYHIRVRAPVAARSLRRLIEQIVEMEKPAYVTYELHFE